MVLLGCVILYEFLDVIQLVIASADDTSFGTRSDSWLVKLLGLDMRLELCDS